MTQETQYAKEMVTAAAAAAAGKQASDIIVLDVYDIINITDYFLICTGKNDKQTKAIADEVRTTVRELGGKPLRSAGEDLGDWILIDYGDFVVHIFTEEKREYYQLERLWSDAPQLDIVERAE